jgi:dTDP-4-amino-4,6-dideoxygalactose transaminase
VNSANLAVHPHDDTQVAVRTSTTTIATLEASPAKQGSPPPAATKTLYPRVRWCPAKPFNAARFADYLSVSLAARQLTNGGPLQQVLAEKLAGLTGSSRPIIPAASGTAALHALTAGWALHKGRPLTWATQAFTFPTCFQGPLAGAIVLDLDPVHWGPSLAGLDAHNHNIDGIIVTNVFGHQADVAAYEAWCAAHGKLLLFDNAATATGRLPDGRCVHDAGDGAIISLHETKPIGRGEGGAVIAPDDTMAKAVSRAMNFGFDILAGRREGNRLASNYRMSDVAAAATLDQLDAVVGNDWVGVVGVLAKHACTFLRQAGFETYLPLLHDRGALHNCLFVKAPPGLRGEGVCAALCLLPGGGVEAKQYYRPLVDQEAAPEAWRVYDQCVCLPLHVDMSVADVEYMCAALASLADKENFARAG